MNNTFGGGRKDNFNPRSSRTIDKERDMYNTSRSMTALPTLPSNWGAKGPSKIRNQNLDTSRSMIFNSTTGYSPSLSDTFNQGRGGDGRHASSSSSRGVNGRERDRERGRDRDSDRGILMNVYIIVVTLHLLSPVCLPRYLHLHTHTHPNTHMHTLTHIYTYTPTLILTFFPLHNPTLHHTGSDRGRQGDALYDRVLSSIADRVSQACIERSRSLGSPFSLLKQFEAYDDGYGNITGRAFESTLGTETVMILSMSSCLYFNLSLHLS